MTALRSIPFLAALLVFASLATQQTAAQGKKTPLPAVYVVLEKDGWGGKDTVVRFVGDLKVAGPKTTKFSLKDGLLTVPKFRCYLRPGEGTEVTVTTEGLKNPGVNVFIPAGIPIFITKAPDDYKSDKAIVVMKDGWGDTDVVLDTKGGLKVDVHRDLTSEQKDDRTLIRKRRLYLREGSFKDVTTTPAAGPFGTYKSVEVEVPEGIPVFMKKMP